MVKSVPPSFISGSARCAMRMKDQQETSIVSGNPSRGTSITRPPSVSLGEKAIEWTTKSSSPQFSAMRSNTASSWPSAHHVQRHEDRRLDLARERLDVGLGLVVEIGDRELGAEGAEGAGAAPGDRLVVGDADDQAAACLRAAWPSTAGRVMASLRLIRLAGCSERQGVPRDHQLLVGRHDDGARRGSSASRCSAAPAALASGSSSAPSQARRSAMRARIGGGVLADPGGEDEGVEAVERRREQPGDAARSGGRSDRWRRPRAGRRWPEGRACRWRRRRGPSGRTPCREGRSPRRRVMPFCSIR